MDKDKDPDQQRKLEYVSERENNFGFATASGEKDPLDGCGHGSSESRRCSLRLCRRTSLHPIGIRPMAIKMECGAAAVFSNEQDSEE